MNPHPLAGGPPQWGGMVERPFPRSPPAGRFSLSFGGPSKRQHQRHFNDDGQGLRPAQCPKGQGCQRRKNSALPDNGTTTPAEGRGPTQDHWTWAASIVDTIAGGETTLVEEG